MARPKSLPKPYTDNERDYIRRVAGKVPPEVIAQALNRPQSAIQQWANSHGISLRVPRQIMIKHWSEYDIWSKKASQKAMQE